MKEQPKSFGEKSSGISIHFHKDNKGRIYKYAKHHFYGKDICVFYCCDKECHATANYFIETKKFECNNSHNKEYEDHIYIKNVDKDRKIMLDFARKEEKEAQVFKKPDGARVVHWYY